MARRVAILRGEALNPYEMQAYEPLVGRFDLLAVGRHRPLHEVNHVPIPTRLLHSPAEYHAVAALARRASIWGLPARDMNRLLGLAAAVADRPLLHAAETVLPVSEQAAELVERGRHTLVLTCWETIPFRYDDDGLLSERKEVVKRATSHYLAVTQRARAALLAEGVPAKQVTVVPAAVDCVRFSPRESSSSLRERWRIPSDELVVLYVGRLIQEKGVTELLRAFASIPTTDSCLLFVGAGEQGRRLRAAGQALGISDRVRIMPNVSYALMPDLYASADLVVAPSLPTPYWEEQFGMVLVEAMASGRPLIATSSGAIPEVVGDAACLVPPYDIPALASALVALLTDESTRQRLAAAGRRRAQERYAVPVVAEQIAACYNRIFEL